MWQCKSVIAERIDRFLSDLGTTGLKVREIGSGAEYLKRTSKETATSVVNRANEDTVNLFVTTSLDSDFWNCRFQV
jgi:hypothetical protein